jgi:chromate reductase
MSAYKTRERMSSILIWSATSSNNLELAKKLEELVGAQGESVEVINLEELNLPLYTPPAEANGIPEAAVKLTAKLKAATGLVVVAPEYNGGVPPVVNNALAWMSRSGDEDWRSGFSGKVGLVATHSGGPAFKYQRIMRLQLEHLGMEVMTRTIAINGFTPLKEPSALKIITKFLEYTKA